MMGNSSQAKEICRDVVHALDSAPIHGVQHHRTTLFAMRNGVAYRLYSLLFSA